MGSSPIVSTTKLLVTAFPSRRGTSTNDLTAAVPAWRAWRPSHQPELDRLQDLNHVIADRRLEASVERARTIDHEVDLSVGL